VTAAISLERACKSFGSGADRVDALTSSDLQVGQGEFVAIVGASGCGKSTLPRLISGLLMPTSGNVFRDGHRVIRPDPKAGIVCGGFAARGRIVER
jgi:NitT/TauT family transport system ATP-binding protein